MLCFGSLDPKARAIQSSHESVGGLRAMDLEFVSNPTCKGCGFEQKQRQTHNIDYENINQHSDEAPDPP